MAAPADVSVPRSAAPAEAAGALSHWGLIRRRFFRHKLAVGSLYVLGVLSTLAAGAEFFAPYTRQWRDLSHAYCPPQWPRFSLAHGWHVPAMRSHVDPLTFKRSYREDTPRVDVLRNPQHAHPRALLDALPSRRPERGRRGRGQGRSDESGARAGARRPRPVAGWGGAAAVRPRAE